jgi:hypothetical protein
MQREPLREPPRVHEHEGSAVLRDALHQPLVDLFPHLGGHDRFERRGRNLDREIERAGVARIDNRRQRAAAAREELRDLLDRALGGG